MPRAIFLFVLFAIPWISIDAAWVNRKAEGWAWYEDVEKKKEENTIQKQTALISASDKLKEFQEMQHEKLAKATLDPTIENVRDYMIENQKITELSEKFAAIWAKVLLEHPELDVTASENPVSFYGVHVQKQLKQQQTEQLIEDVAKENGLFFIYNGNDLQSHAFAVVVRLLEEKYQFEVLGISVDGVLINEVKNNHVDIGVVNSLGITVFPALFVVNPETEEVVPVAFGMRSLDQVEENIFMQFNKRSND